MKRRYVQGKTDYRHRYAMLKNHSYYESATKKIIYRLVVGKKSRYFYSGIYLTRDWDMPDECLYYTDTRRYADQSPDTRYLHLAQDMCRQLLKIPHNPRVMICVDKGRRKHLDVSKFTLRLRHELHHHKSNLCVRGL